MKGRRILRPNSPGFPSFRPGDACFNEGPENSPAKHRSGNPGVLIGSRFNEGPENSPAKRTGGALVYQYFARFNEGPENSPAKRCWRGC